MHHHTAGQRMYAFCSYLLIVSILIASSLSCKDTQKAPTQKITNKEQHIALLKKKRAQLTAKLAQLETLIKQLESQA